MATEARPRAPTISADIAIFFIEHPFKSFVRPTDNGKKWSMVSLARRRADIGAWAASLERIELDHNSKSRLGSVHAASRKLST